MDLIMFEMSNFDTILSMDFLNKFGKKKVKFCLDNAIKLTFGEDEVLTTMINSVKGQKMLNKRCVGYLAYIGNRVDIELGPNVRGTLMVYEFPNIFLNNLLRLALKREVQFSIKLTLGTTLISKALYCMTLTEL